MRAIVIKASPFGEHVDRPEGAVLMTELDPKDVLIDLFDSDDLPLPNPEAAAEIIIQRVIDAGLRSNRVDKSGMTDCHRPDQCKREPPSSKRGTPGEYWQNSRCITRKRV
jgi:hypothetical protein